MALNTASPYNNTGPVDMGDSGINENAEVTSEDHGENAVGLLDPRDNNYLTIARDAYTNSEDWFDAAVRNDIEKSVAHFQSRHAPGSKYYSEFYKHRAKGFRPKTRTVIRKNEALAASAFFATSNLLSVQAEDASNIVQRVSAEINQEILSYRLKKTIPWFKTLIGAYQDTMVGGPCISHQFWDYQESVRDVPLYDPSTGEEILDEDGEPSYKEEVTVIKDTPAVELRPLENVRFSPSANWIDPLGTSPFIIDKIAMTIGDVIKMTKQGGKSKIPWIEVTAGDLLQAQGNNSSDESIKRQRERSQLNPMEDTSYLTPEFNSIWVHRNIIKIDGRDMLFYTADTYYLLSEPIPLEVQYPHLLPNERPYVMGYSILETHKTYPQSLASITSGLQQQANELGNQRSDNVSLVLNKRYYVKRGQGVDLKALQRNVPGGVVLTNNVDTDVRSDSPTDVTSSSYQEQDRINADFDDIAGNFSVSSVGTNRQLNETVGGMELMSGDADIITEYQLRTFNETWVEPVLSQLIRLEQRHETDEAILAMIGDKIGMWERFGVSEIQDDMLQGSMTVEVNVGFGATNPTQRIQRMSTALQAVGAFAPKLAARINDEEVAKEVFGAIGFKDGSRFFIPEVPEAEQPEPPQDPQIQLEMLRGQNSMMIEQARSENAIQLEMIRTENELRKEENQIRRDMEDKAMKISLEERKAMLAEAEVLSKERQALAKHRVRLAEIAIKQRNENRRFDAEVQLKRQKGQGI